MLIVRVLSALARPALAGGVLTASVAGGFVAYSHFQGNTSTAFQQVQGHGERLIISEFGERSDAIVAIDPKNIASRTTIATVDHAPGYGIFATLAPKGDAVAYTALPPGAPKPAPDAPALAAIVDERGKTTLLASDIDLLIPPVWAPDGRSIVVRKNIPEPHAAGTFELLRLGRDGSRSTITTWRTAAIFPIAFAPDGSKLYFATLNAQGSDLYSVAPDGSSETKIAHLSDQITRGWTLSPDGTTLAYSVAEAGNQPGLVTKTLDLASGAVAVAIPQDQTKAQLSPTWKGDGQLTIGAVKLTGGGGAVQVQAAGGAAVPLTRNTDSMDVPIAWSPRGDELAVRSVEGKTPFDAGAAHLDLVSAGGSRQRISNSPDTLVVGWLR
ncbi:MAG: TolB family protein [Dehalococcoidia bacterium]